MSEIPPENFNTAYLVDRRIGDALLANFDPAYRLTDLTTIDMAEDMGIILAGLLAADREKFTNTAALLRDNIGFFTLSAACALQYCNNDMLPPVLRLFDGIAPEKLFMVERVHAMSAISSRMPSAERDLDWPWQQANIEPKAFLEELLNIGVEEEQVGLLQPADIANAFDCAAFAGRPKTFVADLTDEIIRYIEVPADDPRYSTEGGALQKEKIVVRGALRALSKMDAYDELRQLVEAVAHNPHYQDVVGLHISELLASDDPRGRVLLQEIREDTVAKKSFNEFINYLIRNDHAISAYANVLEHREMLDRDGYPAFIHTFLALMLSRYRADPAGTQKATQATIRGTASLIPAPHDSGRHFSRVFHPIYRNMRGLNPEQRRELEVTHHAPTAVAALEAGDFETAIDLYLASDQHRTDIAQQLAIRALETRQTEAYISYITDHPIKAYYDPGHHSDEHVNIKLLVAALTVAHETPHYDSKFDTHGERDLQKSREDVLAYAQSHLEDLPKQRSALSELPELLCVCGFYDEALQAFDKLSTLTEEEFLLDSLIKHIEGPLAQTSPADRLQKLHGQILRHMAYDGQAEVALAQYKKVSFFYPPELRRNLFRDALASIALSALAQGDEQTALTCFEGLTSNQKQSLITSLFDTSVRGASPNRLVHEAMRNNGDLVARIILSYYDYSSPSPQNNPSSYLATLATTLAYSKVVTMKHPLIASLRAVRSTLDYGM